MTKPQISDPPHDTLGQVGSTTCDPDYDVGYGRPPEHGKIKPGEVRNPRGNRKGTRSHKAEAQAMLKMPVPMTGPDGKTRKVTTHEAALLRLRAKALKGDGRALERILAMARDYEEVDAVATTKELLEEDAEILEAALARHRLPDGAANPGADDGVSPAEAHKEEAGDGEDSD